ncbi:hydroxyacylglutathione hydrolase [Limobrevibacterium gyesilva]|uniref:Hydroxyacylglutathione hydrolase n=1 Tax=Limobrevibacterium gyesilva TaxID=2991712 RepID=A0AA41YR96_9PROT|nr:hydroxyacylglutathione hydrolase [Limobrevibacterium gyesilva]MCW3477266.1 hydroxyacylglutathione hydrolase [Limobrevibacterium gyesilva]
MITAQSVPILSDNYAWLLRCSTTGATAIVDPAEIAPVVAAIDAAGGRLDLILLTHHHDDHIAGTDAIRARYGAKVVGATADAHRLPRLDVAVAEGDSVTLGEGTARVFDTPGHTRGHIAYHFGDGGVLLCGDTLFSLGCGRLLEGTAAEMFSSLRKLSSLGPDTLVCCGHEYTESNARFALHADPQNAALQAYAQGVKALRAAGKPTVPSRMADELACNPFVRAPDVATLADLRARKDKF